MSGTMQMIRSDYFAPEYGKGLGLIGICMANATYRRLKDASNDVVKEKWKFLEDLRDKKDLWERGRGSLMV